MNRRTHNISWILAALLAVTLFKGLLWAIFTPVFQAPDENRHYLYIQYLAEFKKLPSQDVLFESNEVLKAYQYLEFEKIKHHPENKQNFIDGKSGEYEKELTTDSEVARRSGISSSHFRSTALLYPPLYYFIGAVIYLIFSAFDFLTRFYALRIFFLILPLCTVFFSYKAAFEFFKNRKDAILVATFVSFLPQYSFVSSVLNNDNLLIALITIFLFLAFFIINRGFTLPRLCLFAVVGGLSLLTKNQAAVIVIFGGIILCVMYRYMHREKMRLSMQRIFVFLGIAFLISGWWYVRNYILWGSLQGFQPELHALGSGYNSFSNAIYLIGFSVLYVFQLIFNFIGEFGWGDTVMPTWIYIVFSLAFASSFMGVTLAHLQKKVSDQIRAKMYYSAALLFIFFFCVLALFLYKIIAVGYIGYVSQARTYFPFISVIFILFLFGLQYISEKIKAVQKFLFGKSGSVDMYNVLAVISIMGMALVNHVGLYSSMILRYYV